MDKFIPTDKLGKKERRKLNAARRKTWGPLNPVTRVPEKPTAYNRKKLRKEEEEGPEDGPSFFLVFQPY